MYMKKMGRSRLNIPEQERIERRKEQMKKSNEKRKLEKRRYVENLTPAEVEKNRKQKRDSYHRRKQKLLLGIEEVTGSDTVDEDQEFEDCNPSNFNEEIPKSEINLSHMEFNNETSKEYPPSRIEKKIKSLQKYVPLLNNAIAQIEDKEDVDIKDIIKANDLKNLLLKVTKPKPGITEEELNKYDRVLKILLNLHTTEKNEDKSNNKESLKEDCLTKKFKFDGMSSVSTVKQILKKTNESRGHEKNLQNEEVIKEKCSLMNRGGNVKYIVINKTEIGEDELILPDEHIPSNSKTSLSYIISTNDNNKISIESQYNQNIKAENEEMESIQNKATNNLQNTKEKFLGEPLSKKSKLLENATDVDLKINNNDDEDGEEFNERVDPLFLESTNASLIPKDFIGIFSPDYDDDENDIVEIIESRSSPILIESDDDDDNNDALCNKEDTLNEIKKDSIGLQFLNNRIEKNKRLNADGEVFLGKLKKLQQKTNMPKNKYIPIAPKPTTQRPIVQAKQNNFLSNINLLPKNTNANSSNPNLLTASVGQKVLSIPNAFYNANQQTQLNIAKASNADAAHCRWLDNFLAHFCCPYNMAYKTCFLLLQRALRLDDFTRIQKQRLDMKPDDFALQNRLLTQLKNILYVDGQQSNPKLTFVGRKFCQLAFVNILDQTITLTMDTRTNQVTSRTRITKATLKSVLDKKSLSTNSTQQSNAIFLNNDSSANFSACSSSQNCTVVSIDKATKNKSSPVSRTTSNDKMYSPSSRELSPKSICTTKTKRRSKRTSKKNQCSDDSVGKYFTYSDDDDDPIEDGNKLPKHVISTKHHQKPNLTTMTTEVFTTKKQLDVQKLDEQQVQSFETAFIKKIKQNSDPLLYVSPNVVLTTAAERSTAQMQNKEENEVQTFEISDDDDLDLTNKQPSPRSHIISKTLQTTPAKIISAAGRIPTNTDEQIHCMSEFKDFCLLCNRPIARVVGHYVNSHPANEVYTSRPSPKMLKSLLNNECPLASSDRLQNGLNLYVATCVFCEKKGCFTLAYWYHHFASHTGEYAYKCNGCGLRKPTRSQLTNHLQQNCCKNGALKVTQQYDFTLQKIFAFICLFCNYTQMSFTNVLQHLKTEHKLQRISNRYWKTVILLELPKPTRNSNESKRFFVHYANEVFEIAEIGDEHESKNNQNNNSPVVANEAEIENSQDNEFPSNQPTIDNDERLGNFEVEPYIKEE